MTRTCGQRIRSPLLYPSELRAERVELVMMLFGAVLFVQEENNQADDTQAKAENESRKHTLPPRESAVSNDIGWFRLDIKLFSVHLGLDCPEGVVFSSRDG